ncbi:hypothetical protein G6F40_016732 [Rhizopus arrhizus]|nr:hypothetical protein G6F40_016732 [Rhizopus arrhizus]
MPRSSKSGRNRAAIRTACAGWLNRSPADVSTLGDESRSRRNAGEHENDPQAGLFRQSMHLRDQPQRWQRFRLRRDGGQQHPVAEQVKLGQAE